jgi:hypothetical protein
MKNKTSEVLFHYWNDLRGDRMAPRRFEIEPSRISDILPDTFILERTADEQFLYRLAGTRVCERFGMELRGRSFLEGWSVDDRGCLDRQLEFVTASGGVCVLTVEVQSESGRLATFEVVVLPLTHTQNSVDRLLGAISAIDAPEWLGFESILSKRLVTDEVIWPEGRPHAVVETLDRQVPFLPHIRNARIVRQDRRQFRVYEGGLSASEHDDI